MNVVFFEAKCKTCGTMFGNPLLSDFSYGQFIARSEDGKHFAYLDALSEPAVEYIENILDNELKEYSIIKNKPFCFQYIISKCADKISSKYMKIYGEPICPNCNSKNIDYDNGGKLFCKEIPKLLFSSFLSLNDNDRVSIIKNLFNNYKILFAN